MVFWVPLSPKLISSFFDKLLQLECVFGAFDLLDLLCKCRCLLLIHVNERRMETHAAPIVFSVGVRHRENVNKLRGACGQDSSLAGDHLPHVVVPGGEQIPICYIISKECCNFSIMPSKYVILKPLQLSYVVNKILIGGSLRV